MYPHHLQNTHQSANACQLHSAVFCPHNYDLTRRPPPPLHIVKSNTMPFHSALLKCDLVRVEGLAVDMRMKASPAAAPSRVLTLCTLIG